MLRKQKDKWTARLLIFMVSLHVAQTVLKAKSVVWKHCCLPSVISIDNFTTITPQAFMKTLVNGLLRWVAHPFLHADASHVFSNLFLFSWVGPTLEHEKDGGLGEGVSGNEVDITFISRVKIRLHCVYQICVHRAISSCSYSSGSVNLSSPRY
jgi:hypothetical protein